MASILVLDDVDTTREFFSSTLGETHELTLCKNWSDARNAFEEETFDLVFLDCWLPDREGVSVLEEMRDFYDGPVVLMSGYADKSIVQKAQEYGINEYLEKPFEPETIRTTTKNILASSTDTNESSGWVEPELPDDLKFYDNLKILLVDDDASTRKLFSHPFENLGLDFQMAEDMDEGWSIFQRYQPNVVILDARMPQESSSAAEFMTKVQSQEETGEETFVIGITGYPQSEEFEDLKQADMVDFFYKPFPITKLLRTLSYLSFVVHKRSNKEVQETPSEPQEPQDSSTSLQQKLIIGLLAILVGLSLGLAIKWTQNLLRNPSEGDVTVDEMFQRIEGYLERDEQREKRR